MDAILDIVIKVAVSLIGIGILALFRLLFKKYKDSENYKAIYEALEVGVNSAQEEFVVWAKRAKEDGKLTKEERQEAMDLALKYAKNFATNSKVKDALSTMTKEQLNTWIKKILK